MGALRTILIFAAIAAVAVMAGVAVSDPLARDSMAVVGAGVAVLLFPLLMRWHQWMLIGAINGPFILGFFPGNPPLWALAGVATLFIAWVDRALKANREPILAGVPWMTGSLLSLAVVLLTTGYFRNDFGGSVFGSENQGIKKYGYCFAAIIVYFALSSKTIPERYARMAVIVFLGTGMVNILLDFFWFMGPAGRLVFFFAAPPSQHGASYDETGLEGFRFSGFAAGGLSIIYLLFFRYGLSGLLDEKKIWRAGLLLAALAMASLGGFRSLFLIVFLMVFVFGLIEKVHKTVKGWVFVVGAAMALLFVVAFIDFMPFSVQRSLSFLPVEVDAGARMDAEVSTRWRIEMWKILISEIPHYLLLGKGFGFSNTDLWFASYLTDVARQGVGNERAILLGDYHSGPLTILIPFGVFGTAAFVSFLWALHSHLRKMIQRGNPALRGINRFLYGYFLVRLINYVFIYGQFNLDLVLFTGIAGLSVAINREYLLRKFVPHTQGREDVADENAAPALAATGVPFNARRLGG